MCQCDESVVQRLEQDFKVTLQQQSSLDQWATWLDNVVSQVLKPHQGSPSFPKAARQFLLKWSFYRYAFLKGTAAVWSVDLILGKRLIQLSAVMQLYDAKQHFIDYLFVSLLPVAPW